jgi:hypothetical protein
MAVAEPVRSPAAAAVPAVPVPAAAPEPEAPVAAISEADQHEPAIPSKLPIRAPSLSLTDAPERPVVAQVEPAAVVAPVGGAERPAEAPTSIEAEEEPAAITELEAEEPAAVAAHPEMPKAAEERPATAAVDPATPAATRGARQNRVAARDRRSAGGRALRAALAAYARDDYVGAARQLTKLARTGNAEAQYRLGLLYAQGKGVL